MAGASTSAAREGRGQSTHPPRRTQQSVQGRELEARDGPRPVCRVLSTPSATGSCPLGRHADRRCHLPEREDTIAEKAGDRHRSKQEWPRPKPKVIVERVAEYDHEVEHQRQIEGGNDETCEGETGERHPRPPAGDEGDEVDAG